MRFENGIDDRSGSDASSGRTGAEDAIGLEANCVRDCVIGWGAVCDRGCAIGPGICFGHAVMVDCLSVDGFGANPDGQGDQDGRSIRGGQRDRRDARKGLRGERGDRSVRASIVSIVANKAATVTLATTISAFAMSPYAYAAGTTPSYAIELEQEAVRGSSSEADSAKTAAPGACALTDSAVDFEGLEGLDAETSSATDLVAADAAPADRSPEAMPSPGATSSAGAAASAGVVASPGAASSAGVATSTGAATSAFDSFNANAEFGMAAYASDLCFVDFYFGLNHAENLFKSLYKGDAIEFPSPEKAMEGVDSREWAFAGWFTAAEGGTMVADAKSNPVGGTLIATKSEVEYYAHYDYVGNYDITFTYAIDGNPSGVTAPAAQVVKVKIGTAIGNNVPTPPEAPAGYKFGGWFDASGKAVDPRYVVVDGAMSFEGRYVDATVEMHAATFVWGMDGVGAGKQTIGPIDVEKGTAVSFPSASEVSLGSNYALVGWFTEADGGGTKVAGTDGVAIAGTPAATFVADATFYAHYKYVGTYSVSFKYVLDDSAVAAAPDGTKAPGTKNMKLKAESVIGKNAPVAPSIDGCIFGGWYVADAAGKPSGSPRTTEQVALLTVDGPVTYIGVYSAAPKTQYAVEFRWGRAYVDEGVVAGDAHSQRVLVEEGKALATSVPSDALVVLTGYKFCGWFDEGGHALDAAAPVQGDAVYTARYEKEAAPDPGPIDPGPEQPVEPVEPDPGPEQPVDPEPTDPGPGPGPGESGGTGGSGGGGLPNTPGGTGGAPVNPFMPWNPPGLALAAGFTMPTGGPGVVTREAPGASAPEAAAAGAGEGASDGGEGDDPQGSRDEPRGFLDAQGAAGATLPMSAAEVAVLVGLVAGTALAAFAVSRVASFLAANARAIAGGAAAAGAGGAAGHGAAAAAAAGAKGGRLHLGIRGRRTSRDSE